MHIPRPGIPTSGKVTIEIEITTGTKIPGDLYSTVLTRSFASLCSCTRPWGGKIEKERFTSNSRNKIEAPFWLLFRQNGIILFLFYSYRLARNHAFNPMKEFPEIIFSRPQEFFFSDRTMHFNSSLKLLTIAFLVKTHQILAFRALVATIIFWGEVVLGFGTCFQKFPQVIIGNHRGQLRNTHEENLWAKIREIVCLLSWRECDSSIVTPQVSHICFRY